MKYYLVETTYTGANSQDHLNDDLIEIQTSPAYTNQSHEPKIKGWCGTTNDWRVDAHGEYDTLEDAKEAAHRIFRELREVDNSPYGDEPVGLGEDTVVAYRVGKFPKLTEQETADYYYQTIQEEIRADMTDEDLDTWFENTIMSEEASGNLEFIPDWDGLLTMARDRRDELKAGEE